MVLHWIHSLTSLIFALSDALLTTWLMFRADQRRSHELLYASLGIQTTLFGHSEYLAHSYCYQVKCTHSSTTYLFRLLI